MHFIPQSRSGIKKKRAIKIPLALATCSEQAYFSLRPLKISLSFVTETPFFKLQVKMIHSLSYHTIRETLTWRERI